MRKENEILRAERDLLKKAAAFFAKEASPHKYTPKTVDNGTLSLSRGRSNQEIRCHCLHMTIGNPNSEPPARRDEGRPLDECQGDEGGTQGFLWAPPPVRHPRAALILLIASRL